MVLQGLRDLKGLKDRLALKDLKVFQGPAGSQGYGCPRASRGIQGPAGTPIPVTIAAIGNSNPQTISPGKNIQFNQVFELNNINFNDTSDTLTILETGV